MPSVPCNTLEDRIAEGVPCTICGRPALRVVHIQAYPDYVTCQACGSAFVVEEGGERVLYGNIAAGYPETARFSLKQWTWPEAIERRAIQERPSQAPVEPPPPAEPAEQPAVLEEDLQPQATPSAAVLDEDSQPQLPPTAAVILEDEELPETSQGVPIAEPSAPEAPAPVEEPEPSWEALRDTADMPEEPAPEEAPEAEEPIPWDRLGAAIGSGLEPAGPQPKSLQAEPPAPPGAHRISLKDLASGAGAGAAGGFLSSLGGLPESSAAKPKMEEQPERPDWLRTGPPPDDLSVDLFSGQADQSADGMPMPEWMHTSPASPAHEAEATEAPEEEDTPWPYGGQDESAPSAAELLAQRIQSSEPEPAAAVGTQAAPPEKKSKAEASSAEIGAVEPPPAQRNRVALRGDHVIMPQNVCAHCTRAPARRRLTVVGSTPSGNGIGKRQRRLFTLPLCQQCYRRATARSDEEKAARAQALLVSALIAMIMVVGGLATRLVNLRDDPLTSLVVLGILAVIGFAFPAIFLLGRTGHFMPPPDAAYVRSTLLVPDDSQGLETAFEWRSEGYAVRFRQSNAQLAVSSVIAVKDRSGISPPPNPAEAIPPTN
jgi:hypothetical protein